MPRFDIYRPMDWSALVHEYDLDGKRLLPWNNYPMPFGGGWCVVRPNTRSASHTQVDQEIFIGIKGTASVVIDTETYSFGMGDVVAVPKGTDHYVVNSTEDDFHFYVIWWDEQHAKGFLDANSPSTGYVDV